MKKVALLGASGLVGSFLVKQLCESDQIESVLSIGRKPLKFKHPKLSEQLGDLLDDSFWQFEDQVDIVYICIGTTKAKTPDKEKYRAIDYGIPLQAGKWALNNGAKLLSVVSSMGASAKSSNFYLKTKGDMELALNSLSVAVHVIRPSMILGPRKESRLGEQIGKIVMGLLRPFIPDNYKPVQAEAIAQKMLDTSLENGGSQLIMSKEI